MWLQWDWGDGPLIGGRRAQLFAAWLAWSRFRVVIPVWDQQMGTLTWCIDQALRAVGGAPTYLLTDNARTVTVDHVAGIPVRHPEMVALGRHYGCKVETCVPFDPESKGGVEATVKIAKADLVPSDANLLPAYGSFAGLQEACREFCDRVNGRVHREIAAAIPAARLAAEREMLHPLPDEPYALALGEERLVGDDQTIRFGSVRYSTPPGHAGTRVWCRVAGEELVITARTGRGRGRDRPAPACPCPAALCICDEHYPGHPGGNGPRQPRPRPRTEAEAAFLAIGDGAQRWLAEAAASGAASGSGRRWPARPSWPPSSARTGSTLPWGWRRSPAGSLTATWPRSSTTWPPSGRSGAVVIADEAHSAQPGTADWASFGRGRRDDDDPAPAP